MGQICECSLSICLSIFVDNLLTYQWSKILQYLIDVTVTSFKFYCFVLSVRFSSVYVLFSFSLTAPPHTPHTMLSPCTIRFLPYPFYAL